MKVPTLHTARLTLRAFEPRDYEPYLERILSDGDVMQWLGRNGQPRSREEALISFSRITDPNHDPRDRYWAVIERSSEELIGHGVLQRLDKGTLIEVGYALGRRWWGAGFATEAARALVNYGFSTAGLDLITAVALPHNAASRRVLEKTGLQYCGIRRYYDKDVAYYELARKVWEQQ